MTDKKLKSSCCFIGHREIHETADLVCSLKKEIRNLIKNEGTDTFLLAAKANSIAFATKSSPS